MISKDNMLRYLNLNFCNFEFFKEIEIRKNINIEENYQREQHDKIYYKSL